MMGLGLWRLMCVAFAGILLLQDHGYCSSLQAPPNYTFIHEATLAPQTSYYDYIIIGGGTAGCPLAATLSQNATVLLLERGGSPYGNPNITDLSAFGKSLADLSPSSSAQRFISEDGVINSRARVLGGGSCLNAGFYTRASADFVHDAGWDRGLVNESYGWVEDVVAFEPPMRQWQSAVRDGLLQAGVGPYNGFTYDHLVGTKIGGTIFDGEGRRHTAANLLKYADPDGLTVMLHASVHKILFRNRSGVKRALAHGVVFRDALGKKHRAYLNPGSMNEIIVSAGALGSPQLLMLSGVGHKDHLKAHNITVVLNQPLVGQGMSDNPMNMIFVPSPIPVEVSLVEVVGITHFGSFIEAASGADFARFILNQANVGMLSPNIGQLSTTPQKQRSPQALAQAIKDMEALEPVTLRGGLIVEKVMGPISTGHLELRNKNPNDNPSVTFNYFKEPEDLARCVDGLKVVEAVIESNAFKPFRYDNMSLPLLLKMMATAPTNLRPRQANTSSLLEQFCKDTVMTIWHYHGGCQVGRVVDSDYRVLGVDALRVIDGSTFNYSPGTNPQATVMMLGRYMGVKILRERLETLKE